MKHLSLLQENLELLLQHTEEVLRYPPYYYSRFLYDEKQAGGRDVTAITLGPYLEFWQQVPVNTAGKLLLTYDLVGHSVIGLSRLRRMFPDAQKLPQEDLEEESGFLYKKPLPGISRYQLNDILRRFMLQFQKPDLPVGAPFELVIQELREARPVKERESYLYGMLKEELRNAVAELTGTDCYYVPKEEERDKWHMYQPDYKTEKGPVTFRVVQEEDTQLKLLVELAVPVKHLYGQSGLSFSSSAVALNDKLIACLALMAPMLEENGFTKLKSYTSVSGGGLEALFMRAIPSPGQSLQPDALARFARLLQGLQQTLIEQGLRPVESVKD